MQTYHSLSEPVVVRSLNTGAVAVIPTDTVYGIVAKAADQAAVARLYTAKHREGKPGTVVAANVEQLQTLGIAPGVVSQVAHLWPNPVSIVLPTTPEMAYLDQGKTSLAVRIPAAGPLHDLLLQTGPLLTSSANQPGETPAEDVAQAQAFFGDSIDFYVDGGNLHEAVSSTVARLLPDGTLEVLRQGAVQLDQ
jgi:L-threonylcarbamoyladenylate synthase